MIEQTVEAIVRDRASDELISVPASATVADAVAVMATRDVGAVLVLTEDGLVAGVFSERDLLARVVNAGRDPAATPLSLVMTRDVRFVSPGTTPPMFTAPSELVMVHASPSSDCETVPSPTTGGSCRPAE